MLAMSAGAQGRQAIQLTRRQISVLGGAINVATELLEQPGLEDGMTFPVTTGQLPIFRGLRERLQGSFEELDDARTSRDVLALDPAEAQAVRDVTGVLEALLQDEGGREILAAVGYLARPDQPVDRSEIEVLMDIQDMVDPTGVRPNGLEFGERREPTRGEGEVIDPSLSIQAVLANAEDDIAGAETPWLGFEQTSFVLRDTTAAYGGGRTNQDCAAILKSLVATVKHVVAGGRRLGRPARSEREAAREFPDMADDALSAVMTSVETRHCVNRNAQETLWNNIEVLLDALAPPLVNTDDATMAGLRIVRTLQDVTREEPTAAEQARLDRVERIREEIDLGVIQQSPIENLDDVDTAVRSVLPSRLRGGSCDTYLESLAELAMVAGQVVAVPGEPDRAAIRRVNESRRIVLSAISRDECLPMTAVRDLRNAFLEIHSPLPDSDADLEGRVLSFLDDVENVWPR